MNANEREYSRSLATAVPASQPPDQTMDLRPRPAEVQQQAQMQVAGFASRNPHPRVLDTVSAQPIIPWEIRFSTEASAFICVHPRFNLLNGMMANKACQYVDKITADAVISYASTCTHFTIVYARFFVETLACVVITAPPADQPFRNPTHPTGDVPRIRLPPLSNVIPANVEPDSSVSWPAKAGHPRLYQVRLGKTWMAVTSAAMTRGAHRSVFSLPGIGNADARG